MTQTARPNRLSALADSVRAFTPMRDVISTGGLVTEAGAGICRVAGLQHFATLGDRVRSEQEDSPYGEIIHLDGAGALVKPYDDRASIGLSAAMFKTSALTIAPCDAWRGRVLDAFCAPVDDKGPLPRGPIERPSNRPPPTALTRHRIDTPVTTRIRAIDVFTPICVGQRMGIFAGSGVGKSTLLGMLANAPGFDVLVIGLIGERGREVRDFLESSLGAGREHAIVVAATGDESALMRRLAARNAMAIAEHFRDAGQSVLLILDSITRYAQASREIAIAAGEPAVARGFPPSVFSDLPRLLERAGPGGNGRGSITGIFAVLVDGDDHNDPVADCIRGILDGHIVLDRAIADEGRYPAINLMTSLSRLSNVAYSGTQAEFARKLRAMVARFEETRDLRAIGGYRRGTDPMLDACVDLVPRLYDVLRQDRDTPVGADAFRDVAEAISNRDDGQTE